MKKIISLFVGCLLATNAFAAPAGRGRVSMASQMNPAPRATVSKNQIAAMGAVNGGGSSATSAASGVTNKETTDTKTSDMREKEKNACISNNIGVGDTFVWASRYSNLLDYSSMIEDVETPENNTCFVKVKLASDDTRINVSDVSSKYFEMGKMIVCGSWANEEDMRQRILDAKKTARVWGTVGASVGGAALGVGAMELFGNKMIGGKVEGQEALKGDKLLRSQLLVLQNENSEEYTKVVDQLKILKEQCVDELMTSSETSVAKAKAFCEKYDGLFDLAN